jgi:hypothetical protein
MFIVYAFFSSVGFLFSSFFERKTIDKFDSQDGYVYLIEEERESGGFDSRICVAVKQHERVIPSILFYRKHFSAERQYLDGTEFLDDEMWKCSEGSGLGKRSIEQIRQRFRAKSSN